MTELTPLVPLLTPQTPQVLTPVDLSGTFGTVLDQVDISEGTRKTYRYGVKDFLSWNREGRLDPFVLRDYKIHLRERTDLTTGTKNLYLSGVRTVLKTLYVHGVLQWDPTKDLKGFKVYRDLLVHRGLRVLRVRVVWG